MDSLFAREAGEVENAFLAAPFEEDGWNAALRLFARRTGSSRAQLLGLGDDATLFNFMPDIDAAYQREFVEIEGWRPEVNWRVAASGRPLEILSEAHYDIARQHSGTDDYEEHIRKWDGVHGCQTVLVEGDGLLVGLAALRLPIDFGVEAGMLAPQIIDMFAGHLLLHAKLRMLQPERLRRGCRKAMVGISRG